MPVGVLLLSAHHPCAPPLTVHMASPRNASASGLSLLLSGGLPLPLLLPLLLLSLIAWWQHADPLPEFAADCW